MPRPHLRNVSLDSSFALLYDKNLIQTLILPKMCEKYIWKCEYKEAICISHIKTPIWLNKISEIAEIFIEGIIGINDPHSKKC